MNKTIARVLTTSVAGALLLGVAAPVFAQDASSDFRLGPAVKTCNQTAKDSLKAIRSDFKAGTITRDERNAKMKDAEKTRRDCVKTAQTQFREQQKAKQAAKQAARKAKKLSRQQSKTR